LGKKGRKRVVEGAVLKKIPNWLTTEKKKGSFSSGGGDQREEDKPLSRFCKKKNPLGGEAGGVGRKGRF